MRARSCSRTPPVRSPPRRRIDPTYDAQESESKRKRDQCRWELNSAGREAPGDAMYVCIIFNIISILAILAARLLVRDVAVDHLVRLALSENVEGSSSSSLQTAPLRAVAFWSMARFDAFADLRAIKCQRIR